MHGTTLLFFLLVSVFCADCVLAKHAHPARPRAAGRHFHKRDHHKRNPHSFDNPLLAKRQVKADDIRSGKKKRDCPVPLVSGVCNCPSGTFCNNDCVNTLNDPDNCGACNFVCETDYATGSVCINSACQCLPPYINCGGTCINPQADYNNCGGCKISCSIFGSNEQCLGAMCGCAQPYPDACSFGCVDLSTDLNNCGECENACGMGSYCNGGSCACFVETDIYCPGIGCTDGNHDGNNCGTCGTVCGDAATCQSGACICNDPSLNDCDGSCVDFSSDNDNCGGCGFLCLPDMYCNDGICELA